MSSKDNRQNSIEGNNDNQSRNSGHQSDTIPDTIKHNEHSSFEGSSSREDGKMGQSHLQAHGATFKKSESTGAISYMEKSSLEVSKDGENTDTFSLMVNDEDSIDSGFIDDSDDDNDSSHELLREADTPMIHSEKVVASSVVKVAASKQQPDLEANRESFDQTLVEFSTDDLASDLAAKLKYRRFQATNASGYTNGDDKSYGVRCSLGRQPNYSQDVQELLSENALSQVGQERTRATEVSRQGESCVGRSIRDSAETDDWKQKTNESSSQCHRRLNKEQDGSLLHEGFIAHRSAQELLQTVGVIPCTVSGMKSLSTMKRQSMKVSQKKQSSAISQCLDVKHNYEESCRVTDGSPKNIVNLKQPRTERGSLGGRILGGFLPRMGSRTKSDTKSGLLNQDANIPTFNTTARLPMDRRDSFDSETSSDAMDDDDAIRDRRSTGGEFSDECYLLHHLFKSFSSPAPSFKSVRELLDMERERIEYQKTHGSLLKAVNHTSRDILLPQDVLVKIGRQPLSKQQGRKDCVIAAASVVTKLLSAAPQELHFLALPIHFQLAFLRILIRLLTNEQNGEYDEQCLFTYLDDNISGDEVENVFTELPFCPATEREHESTGDDLFQNSTTTFPSAGSKHDKNNAPKVNNEQRCLSNLKSKGETGRCSSISVPDSSGEQAVNLPDQTEQSRASGSCGETQSTDFVAGKNSQRRTSKSSERRQTWTKTKTDSPYNSTHKTKSGKPNLLYSVVRLRSGENLGAGAVDSVLYLFEKVLAIYCDLNNCSQYVMLGPLSRLLGILCTAGITAKQLRRILSLVTFPSTPSQRPLSKEKIVFVPTMARIYLVRALTFAAEGPSQTLNFLGKANPRNFFSFGHGIGIVRPVYTSMNAGINWPFKTSFGMACWFRADRFHFDASANKKRKIRDPTLLSVLAEDGAGIEISLEAFSSSRNTDKGDGKGVAATLVVTVFDSKLPSTKKDSSLFQSVRLSGCPLLPQVWYHIAIRHSRPQLKGLLKLALQDEVSVLLDGKVMLTEPLKFPRIGNGAANHGTNNGLPLRSLQSGDRKSSISSSVPPVVVSFGRNFDGQTGALYIFNDYVTDATLRTLFEATVCTVSSLNSQTSVQSLQAAPSSGGLSDQKEPSKSKVGLLPVDVEEIVVGNAGSAHIPNGGIFSMSPNTSAVLDLGGDEVFFEESMLARPDLSKGAFNARLFLVWDPSRIAGRNVVVEAHSGAHVELKDMSVSPWHVDGAKDVIGSIGGVQALLPVVQILLSGGVEKGWISDDSIASNAQHKHLSWIEFCRSSLVIPNVFSLVSSFLRDHSENAREMLRCGGIEIVEQCIIENKLLFTETKSTRSVRGTLNDSIVTMPGISINQEIRTISSATRLFPKVSNELVEATLDLCSSCKHNAALEAKIFSYLFFNFSLWFGGVSNSPGVALHAALLPMLSSTAKFTPEKVCDCVDMRGMIELIRDCTSFSGSENDFANLLIESKTTMFDRSPQSGLKADSILTIHERRHIVDVVFGIIITILSTKATVPDLSPLLHFISYNMDLEWEAANAQTNNLRLKNRVGIRQERFLATCNACTVLLFLLQRIPLVPQLLESLIECLTNDSIVASWILCCMVNSFDDFTRSLGLRCAAAYLDAIEPKSTYSLIGSTLAVNTSDDSSTVFEKQKIDVPLQTNAAKGATTTISKTMKYVGTGLGVIASSKSFPSPPKVQIRIIYNLLWHLLKCHRNRLGESSHLALLRLLTIDTSLFPRASSSLDTIVVPNESLLSGFKMNTSWASTSMSQTGIDTSQTIRSSYAASMVMRLLRFLPHAEKERWLFDILALLRVSPQSLYIMSQTSDWQPCLFHLLSETVEGLSCEVEAFQGDNKNGATSAAGDAVSSVDGPESSNGSAPVKRTVCFSPMADLAVGRIIHTRSSNCESATRTRFDLSLKLYSILLGYCVRQGGDKSFNAVEQAASLQRVCVNGHEVFSILLTHLLAELTENGTILNITAMFPLDKLPSNAHNMALKESARIVTRAILSNGVDGMDLSSAIRQWRSLRHLAAITVAVVTASGFGVVELFDYRNHNASAVDQSSGGLYGIRLADGPVLGIAADDAYVETSFNTHDTATSPERRKCERESYRGVCVVLASQVLSLLDAFVFPDYLDTSKPTPQLQGLALVRSTEPRLGQAQGPLLSSLIRLSLILLSHLEPSSVKFLQCCSRLRCFLHWVLELIRESVALGGYSSAFHILTAPLDRLVLAVVLQCHRALSRCAAVLIEIESSPVDKYFPGVDSRQKNYRRLFRAATELREIVFAAYRGRNEVLRAALSLQAYEALQAGLETIALVNYDASETDVSHRSSRSAVGNSKEAGLRSYLTNSWVTGFHDVEIHSETAVPEQVANGQTYRHRTAGNVGRLAIEELAREAKAIVSEYNRALNAPFEAYCEDQRQWAETDAVRDLEYEGDLAMKRLAGRYRTDMIERSRLMSWNAVGAKLRWLTIERKVHEPWREGKHWRLAEHTDRLHRRILLVPNRHFNSHEDASYELMLGIEREKALKEREERLRRKKEVSDVLKIASQGIVPYTVPLGDDDGSDDECDPELLMCSKECARATIWTDNSSENIANANDDIILELRAMSGTIEEGKDSNVLPANNVESEVCVDWDQGGPDYVDDHDGKTFEDESDAWAKSFVWSEGEQIVHQFDLVMLVSLQTLTEGELLLTTHSMYFRPIGEVTNVMTKEKVHNEGNSSQSVGGLEQNNRRWRLNRLTEVHGRRYMLRAQALELFFADTHELFINFSRGTKERDKFYSKLRSGCKVPMLRSPKSLNPRTVFSKSKLTERWRQRKMSNFDYLMQLNIMAGRTYNDITQYPVFPWVLSDYSSAKLDLKDSRTFRDLSKPVGALNPDRLAQLIERFNDFDGFPDEEKFLYGSHYSSPGVVLHYLIRQEPFTTMAIELQSGRFDCPDRLFFDIAGCWKSCLNSTSDVKELIPEFFTCPEFFFNTNNFPLGHTQSKIDVSNVILPQWTNGSPHEFVRLHRLALESEHVSQNLHHWIDLIFGYKQRGPEAAKAHNVFHYLSYEGSVDLDKITNEVDRRATESHIQNFGQTPSQLLIKDPHPTRHIGEESWKPLIAESVPLSGLRCHTPSKQFGGRNATESHGAVLSINVMVDQLVVVYSDLSVGTFRLSASKNGSTFLGFKTDKIRSLSSRDMSMNPSAVNGRLSAPADILTIAADTNNVRENWTKTGILDVGNWSFGMTLGGAVKDMLYRRAATGSSSTKEISMATSSYLLSCGYYDDNVKVHAFGEGMRLKCSESGGHRGSINCLKIGEDGCLMVTGGQDATCRVWVIDHSDIATALTDGYTQTALGKPNTGLKDSILQCCHVLWGHEEAISCISFSSDLDVVVSGSIDGVICVHSVRRGEFIRSMHVDAFFLSDGLLETSNSYGTPVRKLAIENNGTFVTHLENGLLQMYTVNGAKLGCVDAGEKLHAMEIATGGDMLVTGGENCHVVIRSLLDLSVRCVLDLSSSGPIRCIAFTSPELVPAPQWMYIGTDDGNVTIVDRDSPSLA